MNFGNNLKDLRETRNVTQGQLAEYLQVSRPTIAGYETKSRQPDFEKTRETCKLLSCIHRLSGLRLRDHEHRYPSKKKSRTKNHWIVMWLWLIRNYHSNPNRMS